MRIMHIGQMIGGLDIYIRNSIVYSNKGFEYVIVHGDNDKSTPVVKNGTPIKEYQIPLHRELNVWNDMRSIISSIQIIRIEKPDIIHCHSAKGGVVGRIAGFLTNTKTFYTPHAFSFLSSKSKFINFVYLVIERMMKLNSYLLACSDSERDLGVTKVHYTHEHALVWNNAVPDALLLL